MHHCVLARVILTAFVAAPSCTSSPLQEVAHDPSGGNRARRDTTGKNLNQHGTLQEHRRYMEAVTTPYFPVRPYTFHRVTTTTEWNEGYWFTKGAFAAATFGSGWPPRAPCQKSQRETSGQWCASVFHHEYDPKKAFEARPNESHFFARDAHERMVAAILVNEVPVLNEDPSMEDFINASHTVPRKRVGVRLCGSGKGSGGFLLEKTINHDTARSFELETYDRPLAMHFYPACTPYKLSKTERGWHFRYEPEVQCKWPAPIPALFNPSP